VEGDLLIRGATLLDGTGAERRIGDLLVQGDRIAAIGQLDGAAARCTVDAEGRALAPGFIDTHVHTDMTLLDDPVHTCFLFQGVTTVIQGQDGLSYAPLGAANLAMFRRYLAGLNGDARNPVRWDDVASYRAVFDRSVTLNTAYCVPHAAARLETVGFVDVALQGPQLDRARRLLETAFEQGAVAFSTGLSYFPNTYGDTDELVALSEVAAAAGRPYVTHIRSVYPPDVDWLTEGLEEALTIGRRSGVAVHVSHFGPKPWRFSHPGVLLAPVDRAQADGVRVTLELYPYPSGNTYLLIYLPPWAHVGGPDEILRRIRSGDDRDRLVREIESNPIPPFGTEISYLGSGPDPTVLGRTVDDLAAQWGVGVGEAILRLLDREDLVVGGREARPADPGIWERYRDDVMHVLARGDYMVGSDGIPIAQFPHPRTFGSFPRVLRFTRETGALGLEQAIRAMTYLPARTFGLTDRGVLREGAYADLVLFDAETISDRATFDAPSEHSTGVERLWVNGTAVVEDGRVTSARPGRAVP
jgi:N-acyl-D-amino-acid deacylase